MWRTIRIIVLLFILATVAQQALLKDGAPDWSKTLYVALYPINADGSAVSAESIKALEHAQFEAIETFMAEEAHQYGVALSQPFALRLGPEVKTLPPRPSQGVLNTILWSLRFRWWAYRNSPSLSVPPDVRLYLLFHDPAAYPRLSHSTALHKGRVGLVNVFATKAYQKQNNVVIAHELLHTVAATDKYDLATTLPVFPDGFAEPERQPLYPQRFAELMGGRIPLAPEHAEIPKSVGQTVVGPRTAHEIGWVR